jgi:hypothetical protein
VTRRRRQAILKGSARELVMIVATMIAMVTMVAAPIATRINDTATERQRSQQNRAKQPDAENKT